MSTVVKVEEIFKQIITTRFDEPKKFSNEKEIFSFSVVIPEIKIKARKKMATHLNLTDLMKNKDKKNAKLHLMPCIIKSSGEANVSTYFEPLIVAQKEGTLQSSFRGYPLLGKELTLPQSYQGIVLQETHSKLNEEAERNVYGIHSFDKFTYWNWDTEPSGNDKIIAALEWLDIAKVLHSPVD